MTYEEFVKEMFELGFDWDEIEYFWRNPAELKELFSKQTVANNETSARNEYISNI